MQAKPTSIPSTASSTKEETPLHNVSASVSNTLIEAALHLKLPAKAFDPLKSDSGFLVVMRMATTIEPILNDALESELSRLKTDKRGHQGAAVIANFVMRERSVRQKAKLAHDLGVLTRKDFDFVYTLATVRNHYAHHVRNFTLGPLELVQKVGEKNDNVRDFARKLFGREIADEILKNDGNSLDRKNTFARIGLVWKFSAFLASVLEVIKPEPIRIATAAAEVLDEISAQVTGLPAAPDEPQYASDYAPTNGSSAMVDLVGNYKILDHDYLQMKANADDPRAQFARAVLANNSYSDYLASVGSIMVDVPGFKGNPVTGRAEILYFRRRGKIADEKTQPN